MCMCPRSAYVETSCSRALSFLSPWCFSKLVYGSRNLIAVTSYDQVTYLLTYGDIYLNKILRPPPIRGPSWKQQNLLSNIMFILCVGHIQQCTAWNKNRGKHVVLDSIAHSTKKDVAPTSMTQVNQELGMISQHTMAMKPKSIAENQR